MVVKRRHVDLGLAYLAAVRTWLSGDHEPALERLREIAFGFGANALCACVAQLARLCVTAGATRDTTVPPEFGEAAASKVGVFLFAWTVLDSGVTSQVMAQEFAKTLAEDGELAEYVVRCLFAVLDQMVAEHGMERVEAELVRHERNAVEKGQTIAPTR